jgi:hypothetical protein
VRVKVNAVMLLPFETADHFVRVEVQNHSPVPVFIAGITVQLTTGKGLYPPRDAVTNEYQNRRRLESGESYGYLLNAPQLLKNAKLDELDYVRVSDDVGREYRSSTEELRRAVQVATKLSP